jgi:hypothetical protein
MDLQSNGLWIRARSLSRDVGMLKGLAWILCQLVLILALTGRIWLFSPPAEAFRIVGHTTSLDWEPSPRGAIDFQLSTAGEASGCLEGTFSFDEWGTINLVPAAGTSPGSGANVGIMTITTHSGDVRIAFGGETNSLLVWGNFSVLEGTGEYAGLKGQGTYVGNGGLLFAVQFVGTFSRSPKQ